ncbi:hypothetical protein ACFX2I_037164 [Malus domestica]
MAPQIHFLNRDGSTAIWREDRRETEGQRDGFKKQLANNPSTSVSHFTHSLTTKLSWVPDNSDNCQTMEQEHTHNQNRNPPNQYNKCPTSKISCINLKDR